MKKRLLQILLGFQTKKIVRKYQPRVIAITGGVGKTSTKNAITFLLEKFINVRGSHGNLNTECGVPLVFMDKEKGGGSSFLEWGKIILSGFKLIVKKDQNYSKIIIVEMGADKPGEISYLTGLVKPDIGVITMIGEAPSHLENYESLDQLIAEESKILEVIDESGFVILNYDDPVVRGLKEKTKARIIYFGFDSNADITISDFRVETKIVENNTIPYGVSFNLKYGQLIQRIHLPYCLGRPIAYAVAAAFACGIVIGIDLKRVPDIFREFKPEKGRMNLIEGNGYLIINDTYNASPVAVMAALKILKDLPASRIIAVLGDMKELGYLSIDSHKKVGQVASQICDILITVGSQSEIIRDGAINSGMETENTSHFKSNTEVIKKLKNIIKPGDLILVKGSRSMKMEEIVKEIV